MLLRDAASDGITHKQNHFATKLAWIHIPDQTSEIVSPEQRWGLMRTWDPLAWTTGDTVDSASHQDSQRRRQYVCDTQVTFPTPQPPEKMGGDPDLPRHPKLKDTELLATKEPASEPSPSHCPVQAPETTRHGDPRERMRMPRCQHRERHAPSQAPELASARLLPAGSDSGVQNAEGRAAP